MRGKGSRCSNKFPSKRITPAYAGKSQQITQIPFTHGDHPRLCGEKVCCKLLKMTTRGSPPPMRGKVLSFTFLKMPPGITPAYAGKSGGRNPRISYHQDHPRLCGEKWRTKPANIVPSGSPPPMRGKVRNVGAQLRWQWITPAYAGKSSKLLLFALLCRDHPRLCGEKHSLRQVKL